MLERAKANDLSIYEDHASEWWDRKSYYFKSLRSITPFRLSLIEKWFGEIRGKSIIDFGCGGGLLSIPLLDLGANVTGIDISPASIEVARQNASGKGHFIVGDLRTLSTTEFKADAALLADVLDHIPDYKKVIALVSECLKPGGKLFVSTINRTLRSKIMAIFLGEGLGLVPKGTHCHKLFIRPAELINTAAACGLTCKAIVGDQLNLIKTIRHWTVSMREGRDLSVAYSAIFEKE